ncbi:protein of unknown function (plasmid) [Thermococcus nautili]|nr:protein of unknown function [Thermococcus nautili]
MYMHAKTYAPIRLMPRPRFVFGIAGSGRGKTFFIRTLAQHLCGKRRIHYVRYPDADFGQDYDPRQLRTACPEVFTYTELKPTLENLKPGDILTIEGIPPNVENDIPKILSASWDSPTFYFTPLFDEWRFPLPLAEALVNKALIRGGLLIGKIYGKEYQFLTKLLEGIFEPDTLHKALTLPIGGFYWLLVREDKPKTTYIGPDEYAILLKGLEEMGIIPQINVATEKVERGVKT